MLQLAVETPTLRLAGLLVLRCFLTLALVLALALDLVTEPHLTATLVVVCAVLLV